MFSLFKLSKPRKTPQEAPRIQSAAHPLGGSLIESRERKYVPSWAMVPRTTWTNRLAGVYGLCGEYAKREKHS